MNLYSSVYFEARLKQMSRDKAVIEASNLIEIQRMDPLRIATWRIFRENIF